jgi:hypothetical protein
MVEGAAKAAIGRWVDESGGAADPIRGLGS